jgi:hypothetical protein
VIAVPLPATTTGHHASRVLFGSPSAHHPSAPEPAHPVNCCSGQSVLSRSRDDAGGAHPGFMPLARVAIAGIPSQVHARPARWEEPRWPPGTLRAFFQVYRI